MTTCPRCQRPRTPQRASAIAKPLPPASGHGPINANTGQRINDAGMPPEQFARMLDHGIDCSPSPPPTGRKTIFCIRMMNVTMPDGTAGLVIANMELLPLRLDMMSLRRAVRRSAGTSDPLIPVWHVEGRPLLVPFSQLQCQPHDTARLLAFAFPKRGG